MTRLLDPTKYFNYRCAKCGSTYTKLRTPLKYSNCVVTNPRNEKCNGQVVELVDISWYFTKEEQIAYTREQQLNKLGI